MQKTTSNASSHAVLAYAAEVMVNDNGDGNGKAEARAMSP